MQGLTPENPCRADEIAAYLDGELEPTRAARFEEHVRGCADCAAQLSAHEEVLNALDAALADEPALSLPQNFSQVIIAHAQSDMRGVRSAAERGRALRWCLALAAASFLLLGGVAAARPSFAPVASAARFVGGLCAILWRALYDAGAGLAVIARTLGGHLIYESHAGGIAALLLLASAVVLLARLINNYHRTGAAQGTDAQPL